MTRYRWSMAGLIAAALLCYAGQAVADAIDGDWCHPNGRRFSIRGSDIVTPGGIRMTGDYSRHFFSYVIPAAEADAGQTVFMTLLNENTVQLRVGTAAAADSGEVWKRCLPSISGLEKSPKTIVAQEGSLPSRH